METEMTPMERAKALIQGKAELVTQLTAELQVATDKCQGLRDALVDLGAILRREKKATRGRPRGSKNKQAAAVDAERNAGVAPELQDAVNAATGWGL